MNRMFFYPHHTGVVCSISDKSIPMVPFWPQLDGSYLSIKKNIHVCTPNPGNLIHSESPSRIFLCDIASSSKGNLSAIIRKFQNIEDAALFFNDSYDCLVLSFANDIRKNWSSTDHEVFSRLIEKLTIKVFAFGLGIQEIIDDGFDSLEPPIRNLLLALNNNAAILGVRGFETEIWLRKNGIKNAKALGCPSMFRNPKNVLLAIEKAQRKEVRNVSTAGYAHSKARHKKLTQLFLGVKEVDVKYIFQNDLFSVFNDVDLDGVYDFYDYGSSRVNKSLADKRLKKLHGFDQPFSDYFFFMNSFSWFQSNTNYDLFIGDRLHAAICALLSGVPAILLYQDVRVKEVAQFYGIPSLHIDDVEFHSLSSLVDKCFSKEALSIFKSRYLKRLRSFHDICIDNGLKFVEDPTFKSVIY